MIIYIKPRKKISLMDKDKILLKDISEIIADKKTEDVSNVVLKHIDKTENKNYLITVMDIIKSIKTYYPYDTIINLGENESFVDYVPENKKEKPLLKYTKVIFVSLILFVGSITTIMSFHTDSQMPKIFQNVTDIVFGKNSGNILYIEIPYALGLAFGIIIFFNHIFTKNISDDPTPIEVQMASYDKDVVDTKIDIIQREHREKNSSENEKI